MLFVNLGVLFALVLLAECYVVLIWNKRFAVFTLVVLCCLDLFVLRLVFDV